ncbi:MAG: hypothetical protein ACRD68_16835, partial [Pyrinomonadaceae bacterium]
MEELFARFEVNRTRRWPVLARLLAASFVLHALFVVVVAYVPTARSMFRIAGMFADAEYVDEAYARAEVRERATVIRLARGDKLYYPPGYFSNVPASEVPAAPAEVAAATPSASFPEARLIEEVRPEPDPTPARPKQKVT